jgi:hypothetical protein
MTCATLDVTFLVTKVPPRRGLSWLKRMPLLANLGMIKRPFYNEEIGIEPSKTMIMIMIYYDYDDLTIIKLRKK